MSVEYLVLGVVLVVMGALQTWLRHGAWAKEQAEAARSPLGGPAGARDAAAEGTFAGETAAEDGADAAAAAGATAAEDGDGADDVYVDADGDGTYTDADEAPDPGAVKATNRRGKVWGTWTAVLGPLSIVLGILLIVLGVLGR